MCALFQESLFFVSITVWLKCFKLLFCGRLCLDGFNYNTISRKMDGPRMGLRVKSFNKCINVSYTFT